MNEGKPPELLSMIASHRIDIAAGIVGVIVGAAVSASGVGAIGAGATGVVAADVTEEVLRDIARNPCTPGLDDRYPPIVTG